MLRQRDVVRDKLAYVRAHKVDHGVLRRAHRVSGNSKQFETKSKRFETHLHHAHLARLLKNVVVVATPLWPATEKAVSGEAIGQRMGTT